MTIEHILKLLVNSGKVRQQKNNKFRIITITKWEEYQSNENVQQQIVNNLSSNQQPVDTYKNVKNEKNEKKRPPLSFEQMDIQRAAEATDRAGERFLEE